jgi:hypothetical protein
MDSGTRDICLSENFFDLVGSMFGLGEDDRTLDLRITEEMQKKFSLVLFGDSIQRLVNGLDSGGVGCNFNANRSLEDLVGEFHDAGSHGC